MGRFSEKHSKSMKSFSDCGNIAIQRQLTRKLNTASIHHFADCAKYVGCLALFGMMLCPIDVSANNVVANGKPAKTVVMKGIGGGPSVETNVTNDTIPFTQLEANNSWESTNHEYRTVSGRSWNLLCTKGTTLSFDWAVSSNVNRDILFISLNGEYIIYTGGEYSGHYTYEIPKNGHYVLTAYYSKNGSSNDGKDCASVSNVMISDVFANLDNYLDSLGEHYGLKQELSEAIKNSKDNPEDEAAMVELANVLQNVTEAFDCYSLIQQDIVVADSILNEDTNVDMAEAVKLAKAINLATDNSNDYLVAFNALETSLAVRYSSDINRSEWAFDTNNKVVIDNFCYYFDETNKLAQFCGIKGNNMNKKSLVVPPAVRHNNEMYAVVAITSDNNDSYVKTISLPKTLRYIGEKGLANYRKISEITIPKNVEYIGSRAFYGDTNLSKIKVEAIVPPESNGKLDDSSDQHYKIIVPRESFHSYRLAAPWNESKSILIGGDEGVTVNVGTIAEGELSHTVIDKVNYLQEVNKLVVAGSLNDEDWKTISKMNNLTEIDFSAACSDSVPSNALKERWAIDKMLLPNNTKKIGDSAFCGTGIKNIILPDGLVNIGLGAFENCSSLTSVNIPIGVNAIPDKCFYKCI